MYLGSEALTNTEKRNIIVVDLEATCCDKNTMPHHEREIIQIGACYVPISDTFTPVHQFNCFIKPVRHTILTEFCTSLTGITQEQVDMGMPYLHAYKWFETWASQFSPYYLCSWGEYDKKQFIQDCTFHSIQYNLDEHINIKHEFALKQRTKQLGLAKALQRCALNFEGSHHSAIDDALNTARLLPWIFGDKKIENNKQSVRIRL